MTEKIVLFFHRYLSLIIAVTVGVSFTAVLTFAYVYYVQNSYKWNRPKTNYEGRVYRPVSPSPTYIAPSPVPTLSTASINPGTISWLEFPKPVAINAFVDDKNGYVLFKDIKYHHVANFSDGSKLINAIVPSEGMGIWYSIFRFIQTPNGQLYLTPGEETPGYLAPNIKLTSYKVEGIESPKTFTIPQGQLTSSSFFNDNTISFTQLTSPELITETQYGRLYKVYSDLSKGLNLNLDGGIYGRKLWLRLKDDTVKGYVLNSDFITDDQIPQITWSDGTINKQSYHAGFVGGCSGFTSAMLRPDSPLTSKLATTGQTNKGLPVYSLNDSTNPLFDKMYQELNPETRPDRDTFLKQNNHFFWQDKFGDWSIYISELNRIQAECGKPVIYLYPQKDTQVSVKVGANITVSEPLYPETGWTVLAHPNGQLDYQNNSYPNLFWEGTGQGIYADHSGEGLVVPQSKLVSTLNSQLKQLGLNAQESADFMEFWQSKLPDTPYVRLTWLDTKDMNQLAPLKVFPAPQTAIRIFLEFEGLDKPVALKPQKLSSIPRLGFTLVEWGGLLRK